MSCSSGTRVGAERLIKEVADYWRREGYTVGVESQEGHDVDFWLINYYRVAPKIDPHRTVWGIKSTLINGLPRCGRKMAGRVPE